MEQKCLWNFHVSPCADLSREEYQVDLCPSCTSSMHCARLPGLLRLFIVTEDAGQQRNSLPSSASSSKDTYRFLLVLCSISHSSLVVSRCSNRTLLQLQVIVFLILLILCQANIVRRSCNCHPLLMEPICSLPNFNVSVSAAFISYCT